MKLSKYNIFKETKNGMFILNLISESIIKVDEENMEKIKNHKFQSMSKDDLDFLLDRYIVITSQDYDLKILKLRYESVKYSEDSIRCTLIPTYGCNFNCGYCYQNQLSVNDNSQIKVDEWLNNLLIFFQGATINKSNLHIEWFGGEPTLFANEIIEFNHKIKEVCENNECGCTFSMVSNGYLLNNQMFERLYNSGVMSYLITIDGMKKTHDGRRPLKNGNGSFDTIIDNIVCMSEKANLKIRINIDNDNKEEINDLLRHLIFKGINRDNIELVIVPVYDFGENNLENYIEILAKASLNIKESGFKFDVSDYLFKRSNCMAPYKSNYNIDIYGDVYKCISLAGKNQYRDGYLNYDEMEIKYNDRILDFMTFNALDNPYCKDCVYLPVCNGGCIIRNNEEMKNIHDKSICTLKNNVCKENYDELVNFIFSFLEEE